MFWIRTFTGGQFHFDDIYKNDIRIADIAHALSNTCRFGGHCREFYSVAQHSLSVSRNVPKWARYPALLHDAAEAYIGDIVSPLKLQFAEMFCEGMGLSGSMISDLEERIRDHILDSLHPDLMSFGDWEKEIKIADERMLLAEARDLLVGGLDGFHSAYEPSSDPIKPEAPRVAEVKFLHAYFDIVKDSVHPVK